MEEDYLTIIARQRQFFASGETLSYHFRLQQLKALQEMIRSHEAEIIKALHQDLHKPTAESLFNEIMLVLDDVKYAIKNLKKWMQPEKVATPFPLLWPGKSKIHFEPYGSVFIISPWNYPWLLTFLPLVGAISAGNCVIVKPSEISTHTEALIIKLIRQYFPSEYISVVKADVEMTDQLLKEKFDYIFFTGSANVGRKVMEAAAKHLTPVTLELGGKNPCIIDQTADVSFAARRIIWGKYMNAGQTCIAPDYLLVHSSIKSQLIESMIKTIKQFYSETPVNSNSYGRIINKKQFERLCQLMKDKNIIYGGEINEESFYISPTLIDHVAWDDSLMQEEIFGPLLPILVYDDIFDIINKIKLTPKPLAMYLFSKNKMNEKLVMNTLSFGGGCINDCILQIANLRLPFGGVGQSGMGSYHGKYSFETFSHRKSIYKKSFLIDFNLQYPPYSSSKLKWLRRLLT
jgi:aldehyde dehydrogenase (NAD+)